MRRSSSSSKNGWGTERAAAVYTLIGAGKLNDIDAPARLQDVLRRIANDTACHVDELLRCHGGKPPIKPPQLDPARAALSPEAYFNAAS